MEFQCEFKIVSADRFRRYLKVTPRKKTAEQENFIHHTVKARGLDKYDAVGVAPAGSFTF